MRIEDVHTLMRGLQENMDPHAALHRCEGLRRERTAVIQRMARENMTLSHKPDADNLEEPLNNNAHMWLFGFDVTNQEFTG